MKNYSYLVRVICDHLRLSNARQTLTTLALHRHEQVVHDPLMYRYDRHDMTPVVPDEFCTCNARGKGLKSSSISLAAGNSFCLYDLAQMVAICGCSKFRARRRHTGSESGNCSTAANDKGNHRRAFALDDLPFRMNLAQFISSLPLSLPSPLLGLRFDEISKSFLDHQSGLPPGDPGHPLTPMIIAKPVSFGPVLFVLQPRCTMTGGDLSTVWGGAAS